ncbi:MAG: hypothetical protein HDQ96_16175 [Lachnospiraceae bacterium]|nr:hypothetical protein [Lachnospiraceae bacterium]
MSFFTHCLERAYINLSETYNETKEFLNSLNLMELINAVAKANPFGDGDVQLYDMDTHMFYEGRTKKFIVQKTKAFILGMPERFSLEENMATFVSLRQLKRLIKAFEDEKKHISCYSLIYLYVMYTLLYGKSPKANECLKYIETLHIIVGNYFENNPDDQLAEFFYGCHHPICKAIEAGNIALSNNQLPPVPRNKPQDEE